MKKSQKNAKKEYKEVLLNKSGEDDKINLKIDR
jgi:hypothetical protein